MKKDSNPDVDYTFSSRPPRYIFYIFHGAARIFTTIPLFYLFRNRSPVSMLTPSHWEKKSANGGGVFVRIGALIIFSDLKKSFVLSRFEPWHLSDRRVLYALRYAPWAAVFP